MLATHPAIVRHLSDQDALKQYGAENSPLIVSCGREDGVRLRLRSGACGRPRNFTGRCRFFRKVGAFVAAARCL